MTRTFITLAASILLTGAAFAADAPDTYESKGEFIRGKLDEGLRGDALARAIQDEWESRKGESQNEMNETKLEKLAAKATAKHQGKPEGNPRQ